MASRGTTKPFTIAIIGGGIGGVSLALSLAAQNVPFHIYESAPSFGEIGAGVTFGPNVIRAIQGISPEMLRAYAKHVTTNEPPDMADAFLTYRCAHRGADVTEEAYRAWTPEKLFNLVGQVQEIDGMTFPVRCSVHRAHLLDELVRLLPVDSASFGKALVKIEEITEEGGGGGGSGGGGGQAKLYFADGSTDVASAVIGCDGIKSVTRKHVHGDGVTAEYSGFFGYRAMAPRKAYEQVLGEEIAATGNHFLCPNGYTISYPVDHGSALNMFATCVQPGSTWADNEWKVKSSEEELLSDLRGWHPGVLQLLVKHGNGEKWAMFHSPHNHPYYRGRICLLGDAAHATTPHMGAGAGMAIEDGFILGRLLGAAKSSVDLPYVFKAYDAVRRPRTQDVVRESKDNVARYQAISCAEGQELERLKEESHAEFGKIFNFDLDESLTAAISLFHEYQGPREREITNCR
ncbi:hypothetical protein N0V93_004095 [Gnomoniopsis smithogilvyi]|uniref:FAD-binding domain-containing protein n=1 Tax=Gnomoniopsis smithogilvyi TaxID=1191159 RepID=A0A9W8YXX0_9PEZI|nr:hypothetical protein N0V93_004095 [Gnomoniopsis smithogilvyi]